MGVNTMEKYKINLTLEEIRMIRTALENETDRRMEVHSERTKDFFALLSRWDKVICMVYDGRIKGE